MKKIFILTILTIFLSPFICSCKQNYTNLCKNNITEIRNIEYEYINEDFYISFSGGKRENPYIIDGLKNNLTDYGLVKLVFFNNNQNLNDLFLSVSINSDDYILNLEQNPFDNSYMCDIKVCPSYQDNLFAKLKYDEKEFEINLTEFTQNFKISSQKAFDIFISEFKEIINSYVVYESLHGEFHITLLENISLTQNEKFWYVGFFVENNSYCACIDTTTGKVLTTNFN